MSQSDHVKTEVNLAFNNVKLIIPYCLDSAPFDDDLEYYLSSKQRILSSGDENKDFASIEKILRDHCVALPPAVIPTRPRRKTKAWRIIVPLLCLLVLTVLVLLIYHYRNPAPLPDPQDEPSVALDTILAEQPVIVPAVPVIKKSVQDQPGKDSGLDVFTGTVVSGFPDGTGTYTFKHRRRIDMHDTQERMADEGDYIIGNWTRGHLNYGEWHRANGDLIEFIRLGDFPDIELDQQLGTCVKG